MKKTIKTIGTIATMGIMLVGAYLLGTAQAKTIIEVREVEKNVEVVPAEYIDTTTEEFINNFVDMRKVTDFKVTENSLQLYLENGYGYYWER